VDSGATLPLCACRLKSEGSTMYATSDPSLSLASPSAALMSVVVMRLECRSASATMTPSGPESRWRCRPKASWSSSHQVAEEAEDDDRRHE